MENVVANLSGKVRRAKHLGREYIVAPLSLIVPGVLTGSKGSLYYSTEEIGKNVSDWDDVPILVNHPLDAIGSPISASTDGVYEKSGIGHITKTHHKGKLRAEGWFDVEATRRVDKRVLESLEAGKPIELSTGLFTDNIPAPDGAVHNGPNGSVSYQWIATNYRPDHLAILPDHKGACSNQDGCGVLVNKDHTPCSNCGGVNPTDNGGKGSGDFGHSGRKGNVGGSGKGGETKPKKQSGFELVPGVKSVKKGPDHEFDGTYHVTLDNGDVHGIYFDRQSGIWHHRDPVGTRHQDSYLAVTRDGVLPHLVSHASDYKANKPTMNIFDSECEKVFTTNSDKDYALLAKLHPLIVLPGTEAWLEDAKDGVVIYHQDGKTFKQQYISETDKDGNVVHKIGSDSPIEVKMVDGYYRKPRQVEDVVTPVTTNVWTDEARKASAKARKLSTEANAKSQATDNTKAKGHSEKAHYNAKIAVDATRPAVGFNRDSITSARTKHANAEIYNKEAARAHRASGEKDEAQSHIDAASSHRDALKALSKSTNNQDQTMDKAQLITWLTTNCDCWDDGDKLTLEKISEAKLLALKKSADSTYQSKRAVLNAKTMIEDGEVDGVSLIDIATLFGVTTDPSVDPAGFINDINSKLTDVKTLLTTEQEDMNDGGVDDATEGQGGKKIGNGMGGKKQIATNKGDDKVDKKLTFKEMLAQATPEEQAVWNNAVAITERERTALVERIVTANASTDTQKAALRPIYSGMSLPQLHTIVQSLPVQTPTNNVGNHFAGQAPYNGGSLYLGAAGGPSLVGNVSGSDVNGDDILALPTFNFGSAE